MNVISQDAFAKIAVNKSLLKEYNSSKYPRVVYLNDGDEFQIQLFNSLKHIIAAKIYIDGEELNDMLVLRPGERVWLERYLDKARKFKFSTYEIEDSAEAKEAASLNGEVKIEFYRVKTPRKNPLVWINVKDYYYPADNYQIKCYSDNCVDTISASPASVNDTARELDLNMVNNCYYSTSISASDAINTVATASATMDSCNSFATSYSVSSLEQVDQTIETGRTEEGGYSNQKFSYVDYDFESFPFRTEVIQILPTSRKPYTSGDLQKRYCSNCGRKLSPKHKFCPYCGTKVE